MTTAVLVSVLLAPLAAAAPDAGALHDLRPNRAVSYSGEGKVVQKAGEDVVSEILFDLSAIAVVGPGADGAPDRLLIARSFAPRAGEEGPGGVARRFVVLRKDGATRLISLEPPQELEVPDRNARVYFPFDLVPPFAIPEAGTERSVETEVAVVGRFPATGPFMVRAEEREGRLVVTRKLAPDSQPSLSFNDAPAKLTAWSEEYVFDRERRILERTARSSAVVVETDAGRLEVEVSNDVAAAGVRDLASDEGKALGGALAALEKIEADFRNRVSAEKLRSEVTAFAETARAAGAAALADAASAHLAGYGETFDDSKEGRLLGKLIGSQPPEFSLEGLDGKKHSLRETIKGKVAYLTFWGVG